MFSNYCVISKRIIDSFDDKITDSQKNEFLNFIEEYDNLDNEICNLRIASFFNKHLKEINEFIKEEKTNENWYARFFKQIPNLLYLIFTILWIIISLFINMF